MSVNKYLPHVLVLPEDDANSQIANGFYLGITSIRQMQILPVAGGWHEVIDLFETVHTAEMGRNPYRSMVLLIDFDNSESRFNNVKAKIPPNLSDRVFVIGALSRPEALRQALGSYETIGGWLADDCRDGTDKIWGHDLLQNNAYEIARLRQSVRPFLF